MPRKPLPHEIQYIRSHEGGVEVSEPSESVAEAFDEGVRDDQEDEMASEHRE